MNIQYQPDRGHFVWLEFSPHAGQEQAGRRPALVLSPLTFNVGTGLMLACPITRAAKGGPFEVALPTGMNPYGVVLSDHAKSLDWQNRKVSFIGVAPAQLVAEVAAKIAAIIGV